AFRLFPRLPWELRARIWEFTVEPRTVEINVKYKLVHVTEDMKAIYDDEGPDPEVPIGVFEFRMRASTLCLSGPVPAPLHACREARIHLTEELGGKSRFYSKAFHDIPEIPYESDSRSEYFKPQPIDPAVRLELGLPPEPRYFWVNFELDMIDIGRDTIFDCFSQYYRKIQRLKFPHECGDIWSLASGWRMEYEHLINFINLRECHV
ncbi:hypothetical protein B0T20DRAFT_329389, partial [Sordaria brevicollis]